MQELIEQIIALERSGAMTMEKKIELSKIQGSVIRKLALILQKERFPEFNRYFASQGKVGKAIRLGLAYSASFLTILKDIFSDASLAPPEIDVKNKIDFRAGPFNIQLKSGRKLVVLHTLNEVERYVSKTLGKVCTSKFQTARTYKILDDWKSIKNIPGKPLYIVSPYNFVNEEDFCRKKEARLAMEREIV